MSTIRINAVYCELVLVLAKILRTHLGLKIWHTECWTFKFHDEGIWLDCYEGEGNFLASLAPEQHTKTETNLVKVLVECTQDKREDPAWNVRIKLLFPKGGSEHNFKVDATGELIP